ncbi:MAG: hypothetical protein ACI9FB_003190 [Candidatus Azotimanducaceae bacterium]
MREDLKAINGAIDEQGHILGDKESCFYFTLASLIAGIFGQKPATWMNPIAKEFPVLQKYVESSERC